MLAEFEDSKSVIAFEVVKVFDGKIIDWSLVRDKQKKEI